MSTPSPLRSSWFAGAGRFGSLAAPGTRISSAELLTLVAAGAIAAGVVAFVHLQLRMPGSAILKATLPIVAGVALVPRRGAGTIASLSGMATAGILLALGAGRLPGAALSSLIAIGPAIDLAMGGAGRAGWRIYIRFAAAGLAANLMAFGVRWGSSLLEADAMPPRMMRQIGWNALLSFALCGLLAGLVSAAVCFKARSQHNDHPST